MSSPEPRAKRRGTWLLGAGTLGAISSFINIPGVADVDPEHGLGAFGIAVAGFAIEKITDWLRDRTAGKVDLTDTADVAIAAIKDGKVSADERHKILHALGDDLADSADALIEQHGLANVIGQVETRVAETGVDAGGGPSEEDQNG